VLRVNILAARHMKSRRSVLGLKEIKVLLVGATGFLSLYGDSAAILRDFGQPRLRKLFLQYANSVIFLTTSGIKKNKTRIQDFT